VFQEDGPQHLVVRSWIGQRFALHASSSGKVLQSLTTIPLGASRIERDAPGLRHLG
jgi:DNA-binding IclR family transcriptional regulator